MASEDNTKTIAITGASSGIGREIALELATSGHSFILIGRNGERLQEVQKEVASLGGMAILGIGDVANEEDVDNLYSKIQQHYGKVDVLVANAGVGHFGNLEDLSIQQFDE